MAQIKHTAIPKKLNEIIFKVFDNTIYNLVEVKYLGYDSKLFFYIESSPFYKFNEMVKDVITKLSEFPQTKGMKFEFKTASNKYFPMDLPKVDRQFLTRTLANASIKINSIKLDNKILTISILNARFNISDYVTKISTLVNENQDLKKKYRIQIKFLTSNSCDVRVVE